MSQDIKYCYEDDDIDDVAQNMGDLQIRRLPVLSKDKRLIGIVSLGDITQTTDSDISGDALSSISEKSTQHTSTGARPH
jgi:CBS-domain-containing membrane protein